MKRTCLILVALVMAMPSQARTLKKKNALVSAVGDLVVDFGYMETVLENYRNKHGANAALDYPFKKVKKELRGIVFGNLEAPITARPIKKFADKNERFYFRSPTRAAKSLARAGFDILSLANNHIKDAGMQGMLDSRHWVRQAGMQAVGVGRNQAEAEKPVLVRSGNSKLAFLAYDLVLPKSVWATPSIGGAAHAKLSAMAAAVKAAKTKADAVVVSLHWGKEVTKDLPVPEPTKQQQKIARGLINAGASLVLGHHSHAMGKVEEYRHGLIAYSLGNFVFAGTVRSGHKHSAILRALLVDGKVAAYTLVPVLIDPAQTRYQPRILEEKTGRQATRGWLNGKPKRHRAYYDARAKKKRRR